MVVLDLIKNKNDLVEAVDIFCGLNQESSKNYGEIVNWDVSQVDDFSDLFKDKSWPTTGGDISSWDVSHVTNMDRMFMNSNFNGDISRWDVFRLRSAESMFENNTLFNQDLFRWNVCNLTNIGNMFVGASNFNYSLKSWYLYGSENDIMYRTFFRKNNNYEEAVSYEDYTSNVEGKLYFKSSPFLIKNSDGIWRIEIELGNWSTFAEINNQTWIGIYGEGKFLRINQSSRWEWANPTQPNNYTTITKLDDNSVKITMQTYDTDITKYYKIAFVDEKSNKIIGPAGENYILINIKNYDSNILFETQKENDSSALPYVGVNWPFLERTQQGDEYINVEKTSGSPNLTINNNNTLRVLMKSKYFSDDPFNLDRLAYLRGNYGYYSNYNVSKLDTFTYVFGNINSNENQSIENIQNWDVSNATNMAYMFYGSNFNQDISVWNVSKVKHMYNMFDGAVEFNQPIGKWDLKNINKMDGMFRGAIKFNQPIGGWDLSRVTDINGMFNGATSFNQPIGNWKLSNVTTTQNMFKNATSFNQPVNNWDLGKVDNVSGMFEGANSFDQNIRNWNLSEVTNSLNMFKKATNFNNGNVSDLDLNFSDKLVNTTGMFMEATNFNRNINNWEMINVQSTTDMFRDASSFASNISSWTFSKLQQSESMFNGASMFNSNISSWNVTTLSNMSQMFLGAIAFRQNLINWRLSKSIISDLPSGDNLSERIKNYLGLNDLGSNNFYDDLNKLPVISEENGDQKRVYEIIELRSINPPIDSSEYYKLFSKDNCLYANLLSHDENDMNVAKTGPKSNVDLSLTTYQWQKQITWKGVDWVDISEATDQFYFPTNRDRGYELRCRISYEDTLGHSDTVYASDYRKNLVGPLIGSMVIPGYIFNRENSMELITNFSSIVVSGRTELLDTYGEIFSWNISLVMNLDSFGQGIDFGGEDVGISNWDTSSVLSMKNAFKDASNFNENIGGWNIEKVTNLEGIFQNCSSFNVDLSAWDISNVINFSNMFNGASNYNQNLSNWRIPYNRSVTDMDLNTPSWLTSNKPVIDTSKADFSLILTNTNETTVNIVVQQENGDNNGIKGNIEYTFVLVKKGTGVETRIGPMTSDNLGISGWYNISVYAEVNYEDNNGFTYTITTNSVNINYSQAVFKLKHGTDIVNKINAGEYLNVSKTESDKDNRYVFRGFSYTWQRINASQEVTNINSGSSSLTRYQISEEDKENYIRVMIDYVDENGNIEKVYSNEVYVNGGKAIFKIEGKVKIGNNLKVVQIGEDPENIVQGSLEYQWQKKGVNGKVWSDIEGETDQMLSISSRLYNNYIRCIVNYQDGMTFTEEVIVEEENADIVSDPYIRSANNKITKTPNRHGFYRLLEYEDIYINVEVDELDITNEMTRFLRECNFNEDKSDMIGEIIKKGFWNKAICIRSGENIMVYNMFSGFSKVSLNKNGEKYFTMRKIESVNRLDIIDKTIKISWNHEKHGYQEILIDLYLNPQMQNGIRMHSGLLSHNDSIGLCVRNYKAKYMMLNSLMEGDNKKLIKNLKRREKNGENVYHEKTVMGRGENWLEIKDDNSIKINNNYLKQNI